MTREATGSVALTLVRNNRSLLREWLLDGILAAEGLVEKSKLEMGLSDRPSEASPSEILRYTTTEVWLRAWQRVPSGTIRSDLVAV